MTSRGCLMLPTRHRARAFIPNPFHQYTPRTVLSLYSTSSSSSSSRLSVPQAPKELPNSWPRIRRLSKPSRDQEKKMPPAEPVQGIVTTHHLAGTDNKDVGLSRPKNKQPTHFLCIPLVTPTSRPQLEKSISWFRSLVLGDNPGDNAGVGDSAIPTSLRGKIPEDAIRPLGVLHLTLGVMVLEDDITPEKNTDDSKDQKQDAGDDEHAKNLESSKSEEGSTEAAKEPESSPPPSSPTLSQAINLLQSLDLNQILQDVTKTTNTTSTSSTSTSTSPPPSPEPITLSLTGIHTFSSQKPASVLFCQPLDPTSRLYPFCQKILDTFTSAGLIRPTERHGGYQSAQARNDLVLHGTLVNSTYSKVMQRERMRALRAANAAAKAAGGGGGRGKGRGKVLDRKPTFDAAEIINVFNQQNGWREGEEAQGEFTWARDVVVDKVSLCQMGAKKVEDPELGMEYLAVAEKQF